MQYTVNIKEEALLDMQDAYAYYELQKAGLGEDFLVKLQHRFNDLAIHPEFYSYIDSRQVLRDVALDRFPFVVIYEINQNNVIVYAIHLTYKVPPKL